MHKIKLAYCSALVGFKVEVIEQYEWTTVQYRLLARALPLE